MARPEGWVLTLLVVIVLIVLSAKCRSPRSVSHQGHSKPIPRPLKPRAPDDCPACRVTQPGRPPASPPLEPYSQVKSRRGRRKRIATAGYACPNSDCPCFGIIDDQIPALVGHGGYGRQEYIPDLKCQACQTTPALAGGARQFGVRFGTVWYRLKTPARRVGEVLSALAEGPLAGSVARMFT